MSVLRIVPGLGVRTKPTHACVFVDGGQHAEVGAVDVDTWMEIVAHKAGVTMCTRESYLAKIDSVWPVRAGIPLDNV